MTPNKIVDLTGITPDAAIEGPRTSPFSLLVASMKYVWPFGLPIELSDHREELEVVKGTKKKLILASAVFIYCLSQLIAFFGLFQQGVNAMEYITFVRLLGYSALDTFVMFCVFVPSMVGVTILFMSYQRDIRNLNTMHKLYCNLGPKLALNQGIRQQ